MSKRNIKLTEVDIENIVRTVIEEQRRGRGDLTGVKKRKKDKTDRNSPNWKGSNSGNLNFEVMNLTPIAVNVTEYDFDVRYVDKHILAHNEATEIAKRSLNVLVVCKGRFAMDVEDKSDNGEEEGDGNNNNQQQKKEENENDRGSCKAYIKQTYIYLHTYIVPSCIESTSLDQILPYHNIHTAILYPA